jgi:hypothetical protein
LLNAIDCKDLLPCGTLFRITKTPFSFHLEKIPDGLIDIFLFTNDGEGRPHINQDIERFSGFAVGFQ